MTQDIHAFAARQGGHVTREQLLAAGVSQRTIVHRSTTLIRRDIKLVQGLRVTSPARTLLDVSPRLKPEQLTLPHEDVSAAGVPQLRALLDSRT